MPIHVNAKSPKMDFVILSTEFGYEVWPRSSGYYANEFIGVYPTHAMAKSVGNAYINGFADGVWHGGGETEESAARAEEIRKGVQ